jgi:hypothetical protein
MSTGNWLRDKRGCNPTFYDLTIPRVGTDYNHIRDLAIAKAKRLASAAVKFSNQLTYV